MLRQIYKGTLNRESVKEILKRQQEMSMMSIGIIEAHRELDEEAARS